MAGNLLPREITMRIIVINDQQLNSLTHTLQDIVEVYEEGDDYDQAVASDLREILEQLEAQQSEEVH